MKKPTKTELDKAFKIKRILMNKALDRYLKAKHFDPIDELTPDERKEYEDFALQS